MLVFPAASSSRRNWFGFAGFGSTAATVLLSAMVAAVIGSVVYVASEQRRLDEAREGTRLMRMTRQALMETNAQVLTFLARPERKPDTLPYVKALGRLEGFGEAHLPRTLRRGANEVPARVVLKSLRSAWDDIVAHLEASEGASAREVYDMRSVDFDMQAFVTGFADTLAEMERDYSALQQKVAWTIWLCLVGQMLAGAASILAFVLVARRSARESEARAQAVSNADATREQVTRLFEMTDMLQSASDHADANAVLRASAADLLPGFGWALYVFNNSRDRLMLSASGDVADADSLTDSIGLQQCWALKRGKPHLNRPHSHKLCCEHCAGADYTLEIPMIARGEILGLLQIHAVGEGADVRLSAVIGIGTALADAVSLALSNLALRDKLRSQALRDPLTGLYNRRYMEDTLQRVVRLAERERREVSLVMIDLDHFKRLNDQHGHARGDAVLRDVASAITRQLRDSDVACRYGGEELLIILPHCSLDQAVQKAERLRAAIESMSEPGASITASFGVASIPATSHTVRDLMAAADAALYRAKQEGRNRVVRAPADVIQPVEAEELAFADELVAAE